MPRRTKHRRGVPAAIERELRGLPERSSNTLKQRWTELYGSPPPARLGRRLMIRAIAYRLQEQARGGLSRTTRRQLSKLAARTESDGEVKAALPITVKPGTRLIREWQGITHEVIVGEDGILYQGEQWRSLSAVAREITGARWSGPRFFGLRDGKQADG